MDLQETDLSNGEGLEAMSTYKRDTKLNCEK